MFSADVSKYIREDEPLAPCCWLKIGGTARYFAEAPNIEVLCRLCNAAHRQGLPVRIPGGGSNLLIRPGVLSALVLRLTGGFCHIDVEGSVLKAGSAAELGDVISTAARHGLSGLEHLAGIPGTLGGAVVCNSGVKNDDVGSHVRLVRAVSREARLVELDREALKFNFRRSNLEDVVVTEIELELQPLDSQEVTRRLQANWIVKKAGQPAAGARVAQAFVEPAGSRIVDLLDAAGMRTVSDGDVSMNPQHAGYITVNEHASANDVLALTTRIARAVEVQSGIQLRSQLRIW